MVMRTIYLDSSLDTLLDHRANSEGISLSELVGRLCKEGLGRMLEREVTLDNMFENGPTQAKQLHELQKKSVLHDQGLFAADIKRQKRICENCGKPDPNNDHWDDLDGPNRAGWACP